MKITSGLPIILACMSCTPPVSGSDANDLVLTAKPSVSGVSITVSNRSKNVIEYLDFNGHIQESIFIYKNDHLYEYMDDTSYQAALTLQYRPARHEIPSGGNRRYELKYEDLALVKKEKIESKYDFICLDEAGSDIGIAFIRGPQWRSGSEDKMFHFELSRDKETTVKYPWRKD